jgi:ElaB/YqjD/DUF883 family membrane-anchored ribosome-binding protein
MSNDASFRETTNMAVQDAGPAVQDAYDRGRKAAERASDAVKDYVNDHDLGSEIREFVRDQPWLAVGAAFAIGYVVARLMRRSA